MILAQTTPPADGGFWKQARDTVLGLLWEWLGDGAKWISENAAKLGKKIVEGFVEQLDWTGLDSYLGGIVSKADQINYFFPLYESVAMISWLLSFWAIVKTIRWLLKFIPFVGG